MNTASAIPETVCRSFSMMQLFTRSLVVALVMVAPPVVLGFPTYPADIPNGESCAFRSSDTAVSSRVGYMHDNSFIFFLSGCLGRAASL